MIINNDITVIIPVHKWNEDISKMLKNALNSVPSDTHLMIVTPNGSGVEPANEDVNKASFSMVFSNDGDTFQHLVNKGVSEVKTDWFSVLEFDDEYSPKWFGNFAKYQEYNQQYNIFLPIIDLYNIEGGKDEFIGNGNEAVWASSFSDELGVIDEKSVDDFFDFYFTGGIIKKSTWDELGGLKESIKLTFWYEFLLRAEHNGEKVYVVPKIGYAHNMGRDDSLIMNYRATIDKEESEFWYKTAKKESFYKIDRKPVYNKDEKTEAE